MKKRVQILLIAMALIMNSGMWLSMKAEGDVYTGSASSLTGWQQYHIRMPKMNMDKLHVDLSFNLSLDQRLGISLSFDTNMQIINCCRGIDDEFSWCNFDLEHDKC